MKNHKEKLKEIVDKYSKIHKDLNSLEQDINEKMTQYNQLKIELDKTRQEEKQIINNIEEELGEKIDSSNIMKLL
jgi:uncharacterized coiled-coil DUF342 family protein